MRWSSFSVCFSSLGNCSTHATYRSTLYKCKGQPLLHPPPTFPIFHRCQQQRFLSSDIPSRPINSQNREALKEVHSRNDTKVNSLVEKRKPTKTPITKTSLRRAAVEAQWTRDGKTAQNQSHVDGEAVDSAPRTITAYAVAEQFSLAKVVEIVRSKGYEPDPLGTGLYPQVVHIQVPISSVYRSANLSARDLSASEVGDIFVFPSGTLVTWGLPTGFTSYFATRTLLPAAEKPHQEPIETEDLEFVEDPGREHSIILGETIVLGTKLNRSEPAETEGVLGFQTADTVLTKIAFSSGFARSTKLAVLETSLSTYLASTASIPELLSQGSRLPFSISRRFILRKTGQLLLLRAQLNLYSELTDSLPDLFWDSRHDLHLENYYDQVGRALDVGIRIKILNEKMDYAGEIATVLRERLSEKHGLFLEWTIIVLIAIEVGFEILRLWREGFWTEIWESGQTKTKDPVVD